MVTHALAGTGASVCLIGSCATGSAQRSSDIDVAIDAEEPLPAGLMARIRESLEESNIPYFVDVLDLGAVDPDFRRRVLGQAVEMDGPVAGLKELLSGAGRALATLEEPNGLARRPRRRPAR